MVINIEKVRHVIKTYNIENSHVKFGADINALQNCINMINAGDYDINKILETVIEEFISPQCAMTFGVLFAASNNRDDIQRRLLNDFGVSSHSINNRLLKSDLSLDQKRHFDSFTVKGTKKHLVFTKLLKESCLAIGGLHGIKELAENIKNALTQKLLQRDLDIYGLKADHLYFHSLLMGCALKGLCLTNLNSKFHKKLRTELEINSQDDLIKTSKILFFIGLMHDAGKVIINDSISDLDEIEYKEEKEKLKYIFRDAQKEMNTDIIYQIEKKYLDYTHPEILVDKIFNKGFLKDIDSFRDVLRMHHESDITCNGAAKYQLIKDFLYYFDKMFHISNMQEQDRILETRINNTIKNDFIEYAKKKKMDISEKEIFNIFDYISTQLMLNIKRSDGKKTSKRFTIVHDQGRVATKDSPVIRLEITKTNERTFHFRINYAEIFHDYEINIDEDVLEKFKIYLNDFNQEWFKYAKYGQEPEKNFLQQLKIIGSSILNLGGAELKEAIVALYKLREKYSYMWIISNYFNIPWELIYHEDLFLSEAFIIGKMPGALFRDQSYFEELPMYISPNKVLCHIQKNTKLEYLRKEARSFRRLLDTKIVLKEYFTTTEDNSDFSLKLEEEKEFGIIHYIGHGNYNDGLQGKRINLKPSDFIDIKSKEGRFNFTQKPLMFINACYSSFLDYPLYAKVQEDIPFFEPYKIDHFLPMTLLKNKVSAVIVNNYSLIDNIGKKFSDGFYNSLIKFENNIGCAFKSATEDILHNNKLSDNEKASVYLYNLYGDPRSAVVITNVI